MRITTVLKITCPGCGAVNYLSAGDPNDLTGFDPEGLRCRQCKRCYRIGGPDGDDPGDDTEVTGEGAGGPYFEDGMSKEELD